MAAIRTCLVALVVALGFVFLESPTTAAAAAETAARMSAEQRQEVQSLLRRLNKTPLATIEVDRCIELLDVQHDVHACMQHAKGVHAIIIIVTIASTRAPRLEFKDI
jgi:hypothetical protein